jgi:CBS domain-containing protein
MTIAGIVRKDVVTLRAEDAIEAAWGRMREQRLGQLPVVDARGHLVGMLAEHDLLDRLAPAPMPSRWTLVFDEKDRLAAGYLKSVGATVGELMTPAPPAIVPDASIETAARLMRRHAIGALPVVLNDVCIGVVTRADVLDHLAWPPAGAPGAANDGELERQMLQSILEEMWASRYVTVEARRGVIRLGGAVAGPAERSALVAMARALPGCGGVEDRLAVLGAAGVRQPAPVI